VVAGAGVGACSDNVQPVVQANPLDAFWEENRFESVGANTGCGFDMAAYPGIVPLGGTAPGVVTLAYRDYQGRGRVYFVESDWQDTQPTFTAQSAGLMHYMINHGAGGALNFSGPEVNRALYVRNLPFKITAEEMYDIFGKFGAIRQIRLGNAADTRGTAFVVYEDIFDA
jgi:hypothetical protein